MAGYTNIQRKNFAAAIEGWVGARKEQVEFVLHESTKEVVEQMQRIGPSSSYPQGEGGAMPVDTGWLRDSIEVSHSQMPQINPESFPPEDAGPKSIPYDKGRVDAAIEAAKLGGVIYIGYTAAYAGIQDAYRNFVAFAGIQWMRIVERKVQQSKAQSGAKGARQKIAA